MPVPPPLTDQEITTALASLAGWRHEDDKLQKTYRLPDFRQAIGFVVRVAFEAEQRNHHPELFNVYGTVSIALTTHDAGNRVTRQDVALAQAIDRLGAPAAP